MNMTAKEKRKLDEAKEFARAHFVTIQNFADKWKLATIRVGRVLQPVCGACHCSLEWIINGEDPTSDDFYMTRNFDFRNLVAPYPHAVQKASNAIQQRNLQRGPHWVNAQALALRLDVRPGELLLALSQRMFPLRYADSELLEIQCGINDATLAGEIWENDL
jgi:hypothetical protein